MPKLYYSPTSCGAANFIAARLAGVELECEQVDLATHKCCRSGEDFYRINHKGNLPTIVLEDGSILNENAATLQYIGDLDKEGTILPAFTSNARYQVMNALCYIGTELHATVGPLFNPALDTIVHDTMRHRIFGKWTYLNDRLLHKHQYLVDNKLSIADIYLYIVLSWSTYLNLDFSSHPNIVAFYNRMDKNPAIQEAHAAMASDPVTTLSGLVGSKSSRK